MIISIPFVWEESPGKPFSGLIMHEELESSNSSDDGSDHQEDWYSPESLFPLAVPKSGFLNKAVHWEDKRKNWREECGIAVKRTLTLGELILMSRKLSCGRKAADLERKKFSMEFIRELFPSCFYQRMTDFPVDVNV